MDARIAALEGELEEEQTQSEMLMERARKSQINIEQLSTELASERGSCQKMENTKMMLERQNKELKAKLEEVENSNRAKAKAAIGKNYKYCLLPTISFFPGQLMYLLIV